MPVPVRLADAAGYVVKALLCTVDDLVLQFLAQVAEVIAVACNAYDKVLVLLGVCLGGKEGLTVDNVELDVVTVHIEVGADKVCHLVEANFARNNRGGELLIQQGAAGGKMVHLGTGIDNCGGTEQVSALLGGNALRYGLVGKASVGDAPITSPKYTWQVVGSILMR